MARTPRSRYARRFRIGDEHGFSLPEVLLAATLMSVGVAATLGTFGAAGRATLRAQQVEVAVQQAQAELDRVAALPYGALALAATPVASSNPRAPGFRVEGAAMRIRADLTEPFVMAPGGDQPASVDPGPESFAVGSGESTITGKIYRYVTWRNEECVDSRCEGTQDTKRLTVAATLDPGPGTDPAPVWLTTVITDPEDAPPGSQAVPDGGPGGGEPVRAQSFYLYDTVCGQAQRQVPAGAHATRDTAATGSGETDTSACENPDASRQPDLMGSTAPPGDNSTPVHEYSSDLTGEYDGGLAMIRRGGSCSSAYAASDATSQNAPGKWSVHAWSTSPFGQIFHLNGLVTLSLFTSTVGGVPGSGKLCATLVDRGTADGPPADRALGTAVYDLPSWPTSVRRVTFSFRLPQEEDLLPGHRLMLVLHLRGESTRDVVLVYDHPLHPSLLEVATATPL